MTTTSENHGHAGISYYEEVKRKLIHLSSLWMVVAICCFERKTMIIAFGVMLALNLLFERMRALRTPGLTPLYDFFFGRMLRKEPSRDQWIVSGGPYVFASALLSVVLFQSPIAATAMAVLLIGDTFAALIGRKFGKHKTVNGKSFEGIAAFVISGFIAAAVVLAYFGMPRWFYALAFAGVVVSSLVELFEKQIRLDDNFSIPIAMGAVLSIPHWLEMLS